MRGLHEIYEEEVASLLNGDRLNFPRYTQNLIFVSKLRMLTLWPNPLKFEQMQSILLTDGVRLKSRKLPLSVTINAVLFLITYMKKFTRF